MASDGTLLAATAARLIALVDAGGPVMWPLFAVGLLTWTLLGLRVMTLLEVRRAVRRLMAPGSTETKTESSRLLRTTLFRHGAVVDTLVASAPLLGLLGTVSGMIATFEGLTEMTLFSESGGIAGGIAEALTTTQAGLVIAIPAFFAGKIIGRKATKLAQQLDAFDLVQASPSRRSAP